MTPQIESLLNASGIFWTSDRSAVLAKTGCMIDLPTVPTVAFYASPKYNQRIENEAIWIGPEVLQWLEVDFAVLHELGHSTMFRTGRNHCIYFYDREECTANAIAVELMKFFALPTSPKIASVLRRWPPIDAFPPDVKKAVKFILNNWYHKKEAA